jgi:predicted GNAT superfamily acetyltransferase
MTVVSILPVTTIVQCKQCEHLQQTIWGADPLEVVPAEVLIVAQRHGGLVLGAFDSSGQMVGFLFGFLGRVSTDNRAVKDQGQWQHYSHVLGVVSEWRRRGVGYRLKLAQRDWVMAQGIELVTWTCDPLEAANGMLNFGRLGAVSRSYLRDVYGPMPDRLNAGLPSDRFEVTWHLMSERVGGRLQHGWQPPSLEHLLESGAIIANPARLRADKSIEPDTVRISNADQVLVEIPSNIQAIKEVDLELALQWRMNVREVIESLFDAGFTVCDIVQAGMNSLSRTYYLLQVE